MTRGSGRLEVGFGRMWGENSWSKWGNGGGILGGWGDTRFPDSMEMKRGGGRDPQFRGIFLGSYHKEDRFVGLYWDPLKATIFIYKCTGGIWQSSSLQHPARKGPSN